MKQATLTLLETITRETRVTPPRTFHHARHGRTQLRHAAPRAELVEAVARLLYLHYYLGDEAAVSEELEAPTTLVADDADPAYVAMLRRANQCPTHWDEGWTVIGLDGGRTRVRKGALTLLVRPEELRGQAVRFPNERRCAMRGFYAAIGPGGVPPRGAPVRRFYLHLTPEGGPPVMAYLTARLSSLGLPFVLKILSSPERFTRPDAATLYLATRDVETAVPFVREVARMVAQHLRPTTPAFTSVLAPGLAFADEPDVEHRTSFGRHRCGLIAGALVDAASAGRNSAARRLDAALAAFARAGIALDAPFANPPGVFLEARHV